MCLGSVVILGFNIVFNVFFGFFKCLKVSIRWLLWFLFLFGWVN